jgi:hypothetical protein
MKEVFPMKDYPNIIKSAISSKIQNYNDHKDADTQFHALDITFLDVIFSIIVIEKTLDIDFISWVEKDKILNYTVNDFIAIAEKIAI